MVALNCISLPDTCANSGDGTENYIFSSASLNTRDDLLLSFLFSFSSTAEKT